MISSSDLALAIYNDLDQNGYTSAADDSAMLQLICDAANFVCAYAKWPFTLVSEEHILPTATKTFTIDNEIFFPYAIHLDEQEKGITNIPITPYFVIGDGANKAHISENVVNFSEAGKKVNILYHRGFNYLDLLGQNDMFFPRSMFKAIQHIALWFYYPSGLDIGSSLANQHFSMAKTILDTYAKAYGSMIQPKKVEAATIYNQH